MAVAVQFYHLLSTPLEKALPQLVERAYGSGARVAVLASDVHVPQLDDVLWAYQPTSFLPHGVGVDIRLEVNLCTGALPEDATMVFITNGAVLGREIVLPSTCERVFDMFDGADDAQVVAARERWKTYQDAGYAMKYIRQNDRGGWDTIKEVMAR